MADAAGATSEEAFAAALDRVVQARRARHLAESEETAALAALAPLVGVRNGERSWDLERLGRVAEVASLYGVARSTGEAKLAQAASVASRAGLLEVFATGTADRGRVLLVDDACEALDRLVRDDAAARAAAAVLAGQPVPADCEPEQVDRRARAAVAELTRRAVDALARDVPWSSLRRRLAEWTHRLAPEPASRPLERVARERGVHLGQRGEDGSEVVLVEAPGASGSLLRALFARLDAESKALTADPADSRTREQARFDVLVGLVHAVPVEGEASPVRVSVDVTIPVEGLAGAPCPGVVRSHGTATGPAAVGGEPVVLPAAFVAELCRTGELFGVRPEFRRLWCDPVTGAPLHVEERVYRFPAMQQRLIDVRNPTCTARGCPRPSAACDTDHRRPYAEDGATCACNGHPLCEPHHLVKTHAGWDANDLDESGRVTWISPRKLEHTTDPPPVHRPPIKPPDDDPPF